MSSTVATNKEAVRVLAKRPDETLERGVIMTSEKDEVIEGAEKVYMHKIIDPIGYGWCEATRQLCVFDRTNSVRCGLHPSTCGHITRPQFIRRGDKETYRVKKAVENNQAPDSDPDPNAHQ